MHSHQKLEILQSSRNFVTLPGNLVSCKSNLASQGFSILLSWQPIYPKGSSLPFLALSLTNLCVHKTDIQLALKKIIMFFNLIVFFFWYKSCRDEVEKMFASASDKVNGQFYKPIHKNFLMCQLFCNCIHLMLPTHIQKVQMLKDINRTVACPLRSSWVNPPGQKSFSGKFCLFSTSFQRFHAYVDF